ncbi:MAG: hypothetical protein PHS33_08980 [Candidatus Omnitrophica bacterium]|nr:hypothetical protein [Candidatus Omnitrophota bacterium]
MFTTYASRSNLIVDKIEITAEGQAILDLFKENQSIELDAIPGRISNKALQSLIAKKYVRTAGNNTVVILKKAGETNDDTIETELKDKGYPVYRMKEDSQLRFRLTNKVPYEDENLREILKRNNVILFPDKNGGDYYIVPVNERQKDFHGDMLLNTYASAQKKDEDKLATAQQEKRADIDAPTKIELEHKPTFQKIRKDVKEDGKLDLTDKDMAKSITEDHGEEVNPDDPKEGRKDYYDPKNGLPALEKKLENKEAAISKEAYSKIFLFVGNETNEFKNIDDAVDFYKKTYYGRQTGRKSDAQIVDENNSVILDKGKIIERIEKRDVSKVARSRK